MVRSPCGLRAIHLWQLPKLEIVDPHARRRCIFDLDLVELDAGKPEKVGTIGNGHFCLERLDYLAVQFGRDRGRRGRLSDGVEYRRRLRVHELDRERIDLWFTGSKVRTGDVLPVGVIACAVVQVWHERYTQAGE